MRPLTVITGILLGSCTAISLSLAAVLFVFLVLDADYPRLRHELRPLTQSLFIFLGMTSLSGLSFYASTKNHRLKSWSQLAMWSGLAATTWFYWP